MSMQWGCPWHGPVQGGKLTLPNGQQMAWPQPLGDTPDDAGFTLHVRMPDVPPVERTDDELAADQASGMQWLDSALIAGAGRQELSDTGAAYLHGRSVGGWIYAAPDGSRWLVRGLGRKRMYSSDLFMTLSLSRFGVLGGKAKSYSVSASITAAQQDQASWSSSTSDSPSRYRYWQVQDVTHAGDRAIVMVYVARDKALPLGFVLLTLSGTPGVDLVASLTKLAGRAEIEQGREVSNVALPLYRAFSTYTEETLSADPLNPRYARNYGSLTWAAESNPLPEKSQIFYSGIPVGSGESVARVTRLVAMWFDPDGVAQPVRLTTEKRAVMSYPMPAGEVSGRRVASGTGDMNVSVYEYPEVTLSREVARTAVTRYRLSFGGQLSELECVESAFITFREHLEGGAAPTPNTRPPGTWRLQEVGVSLDVGGALSEQWSDSVGFSRDLAPIQFNDLDALPGGDGPLAYSDAVRAYVHARPATMYAAVRRFANNLIAVQALRVPGGGQDVLIVTSSPLTPAGASAGGADLSVAPSTGFAALLPYGSHNPITGESAICRAAQVSWT